MHRPVHRLSLRGGKCPQQLCTAATTSSYHTRVSASALVQCMLCFISSGYCRFDLRAASPKQVRSSLSHGRCRRSWAVMMATTQAVLACGLFWIRRR